MDEKKDNEKEFWKGKIYIQESMSINVKLSANYGNTVGGTMYVKLNPHIKHTPETLKQIYTKHYDLLERECFDKLKALLGEMQEMSSGGNY